VRMATWIFDDVRLRVRRVIGQSNERSETNGER